jgi:hypothetical protein
MKIRFTGWIDLKEVPDDRGSIDNWLAGAIEGAAIVGEQSVDGLKALEILHIKWVLEG